MTKRSQSSNWMTLGVGSLLLSGLLAAPILSGKIPFLAALLPDRAWLHWSLVLHVILSLLVWHTTLQISLTYAGLCPGSGLSQPGRIFSRFGLGATVSGCLLMLCSIPVQGAVPVLSNYLPVVVSPLFGIGFVLCLCGLLSGFLGAVWGRRRDCGTQVDWPGLEGCRLGLALGSLTFVFALATLLAAVGELQTDLLAKETYVYEFLMWGTGHLLAHGSAIYLAVGFTVCATMALGSAALSRGQLQAVFLLLGLPLLVVPYLTLHSVFDPTYRQGFTQLMRWGIFPSFLLYCVFFVCRWGGTPKTFQRLRHSLEGAGFLWSLSLLALGMTFGALIRGPDLRVPGHYHATIGACTLLFMTLVLSRWSRSEKERTIGKAIIWLYGFGQTLFASGLFVAGYFGVPRKTYGAELVSLELGQKFGFGVLGVGGVLAYLAGALFALFVLRFALQAVNSRWRPL